MDDDAKGHKPNIIGVLTSLLEDLDYYRNRTWQSFIVPQSSAEVEARRMTGIVSTELILGPEPSARDAAFDAMLRALKLADDLVFAPMRNRKLVMDEHRHTVDEAIRSAIAHAEKVK